MALSPTEFAKLQGHLAAQNVPTVAPEPEKSFFDGALDMGTAVSEALGFGAAVDTFGSHWARALVPEDQKDFIEKPSTKETVGAALQVGATALPIGAGANLARQVAVGAGTGYLMDAGSDLAEDKTITEALIPGAGTAVGALVPPALRGAGTAVGALVPPALRGAGALVKPVINAASKGANAAVDATQGITQVGKEMADRVPRFVGRVKTGIEEAADRAAIIKESTPAVGNAVKSGLDERIINTVTQADAPTVKAYKEMIDIAENPGKTLKMKERPEIVAGRAAGEQYKLIDAKRKEVGKEIGAAVDKLSKNSKVSMEDSYAQIDEILDSLDITHQIDEDGVKMVFKGRFTPQERARIKELYTLARESGDSMTPRQIYNMDQLFSKLQRETRMEGIGDIIIDTPDGGKTSLFRVFRDIFTNKLDEVAPDIRPLNKAYRNLVTFQDDLERSIIKRGNFENSKGIDPAEFAQTNLRRLDSDALSAADYRQIVEEMDAVARELGYTGPRADELITFANELRRIYPDAVPNNSFSGGIGTGIMNMASKVLDIGKADVTDQQKALRQLLESLISAP